MSKDDGVVLLIGSGWRPYREYLLQGLAQHLPLWLIDERPPTWQRRYLIGSSVVGALDEQRAVADRNGLIEAALEVAKDCKVAGVLTYDELLVTATAHVAERLGVRGLSVRGAENCRDKARSRAELSRAGIAQPRYAVVHDLEAALEAGARIGYPVVSKPRGMGASVGVARADDPAGLKAAFEVAERARRAGPPVYEDGVLIEEMVDGPEISIDGAVFGGEYRPFCLARKHLGAPPYFEEVGHLVDAADPLAADPELQELLARAHRTLGVHDGITHTEIRLTSRGPVIIEVNARLGGDLIPYLGKLATGVDPGLLAAQIAAGAPPSLEATSRRCAGIRFLYPPQDCRVLEVSVPDPASVPNLVQAHAMAGPGTELRLPPSTHLCRHAYVLAVAPSRGECEAALDQAAALVELRYEPLDQDEPFQGRPW
ncbi:ATP-grasp domain-containing protein [Jatrophihabitans sp.]|uniref:ATP-grasp domain-containing protein n=1 Tax=Jatrophihabitans sp. TaxID=1932789 RepID=UPI002EE0DCD8